MAENGNRNSAHVKSDKYVVTNYDVNEISPLRTSKDSSELEENNPSTNVQVTSESTEKFAGEKKPNKSKLKGVYKAGLTRLDISKKARLPFLLVIILCALLIVVVIVLIAFWPRIPYYMKADVCLDKECLDASAQILLWANTSNTNACDDPYEWACGRFENEYLQHDFYGVNGGEWTIRSFENYEEISKIHSFVAKLSSAALSSSAQLMLKGLHQACMGIEMLDKSESDSALKNAIFTLLGWIYGESYDPHVWDFKIAMIKAHSQYGLAPFFKISVENRNSPPFGNIITISEGDVGLPHQIFYELNLNNKITIAYQLLMRDFAINMGVVSDKAKKFAEQMYHFEKRIVSVIKATDRKERTIHTLKEVQSLAPSLPIFETITTTFSHTKITEETMVLVDNLDTLRQMSIIVSTTDELPLNSFIIWSLARHYLPFLSREYRAALDEYESVLYGYKSTPPSWYFCSKLLKDWVPFALDTLQQNPQLIVTQRTNLLSYDNIQSESNGMIIDRINYNHELTKLIFYHLRNEIKRSIDENVEIDQATTNYIINKLQSLQLQIGIPNEVLKTDTYVNRYYSELFWRKLHFIDNIQSHWSFQKLKLEDQLKPMNRTDKIISYMFPVMESGSKMIQYSIDLNTIIISDRAINKPYFHYKYPLAINFGRLGVDLSRTLLNAVFLLKEQHLQNIQSIPISTNSTPLTQSFSFVMGNSDCIENHIKNPQIPKSVRKSLVDEIAGSIFAAKSFFQFLHIIQDNKPIPAPELTDQLTYDNLGLRNRIRQVGLRQYDSDQLFALTIMQRYCAISTDAYRKWKPFIEQEISRRIAFNITWNEVNRLPKSLYCSTKHSTCGDYF